MKLLLIIAVMFIFSCENSPDTPLQENDSLIHQRDSVLEFPKENDSLMYQKDSALPLILQKELIKN